MTEPCLLAAVLSENEDIVMVDLEQQFWPYLLPKSWGPLALWVHVILTLEDSKSSKKGVLAACYFAHVLTHACTRLTKLLHRSTLHCRSKHALVECGSHTIS